MIKYLRFILIFLSAGLSAGATQYYVDASSGNQTQDGGINSPFVTMAQVQTKLGSAVRGDMFSFRQGTGIIGKLTCSKNGITFNSYGAGAQPVLQYPVSDGTAPANRVIIYITGTGNVVDGLEFEDTTMSDADHSGVNGICNVGYAVDIEADSNKVQNCWIRRMGVGVEMHGSYCSLLNSHIEDLRMVLVTPQATNPNDDYGANGVVVSGHDNVVDGNTMNGCWAPCDDFGSPTYGYWDGGAVEVFGTDCSRDRITNNYCYDNEGIFEFGGPSATASTNKADSFICRKNKFVDNGRTIWVNSNMIVTNCIVDSCNIQENIQQREHTTYMFSISASEPVSSGIIQITHCVFTMKTPVTVYTSGAISSGKTTHSKNNYFLTSGCTLGDTMGGSELHIITSNSF